MNRFVSTIIFVNIVASKANLFPAKRDLNTISCQTDNSKGPCNSQDLLTPKLNITKLTYCVPSENYINWKLTTAASSAIILCNMANKHTKITQYFTIIFLEFKTVNTYLPLVFLLFIKWNKSLVTPFSIIQPINSVTDKLPKTECTRNTSRQEENSYDTRYIEMNCGQQ